jgi:glycosyltransferase involved in cell wall biosynthesis
MTELIEPGKTGVLFRPGDAQDMARRILRLAGDGPALSNMRAQSRQEFLERYSAAENYRRMMEIYDRALARRGYSERAIAFGISPAV